MRKRFLCGHTGKGAYCHRCAAEAQAALALVHNVRAKRTEKHEMRQQDAIDLTALDHMQSTQSKARSILAAIQGGKDYRSFQGKLLKIAGGQVVSVPVGWRYRLLFNSASMRPLQLVSHEEYNKVFCRADRLRELAEGACQ